MHPQTLADFIKPTFALGCSWCVFSILDGAKQSYLKLQKGQSLGITFMKVSLIAWSPVQFSAKTSKNIRDLHFNCSCNYGDHRSSTPLLLIAELAKHPRYTTKLLNFLIRVFFLNRLPGGRSEQKFIIRKRWIVCVSWCFTCASRCFTLFYKCFTMFSNV